MVKSQQKQFLRLYGKSNNIVRINNSIAIIRIRFSNHAFDHRRRPRTFLTNTCPSSIKQSSSLGKPSEDGKFSLISNTIVYFFEIIKIHKSVRFPRKMCFLVPKPI